MAVIHFPHKSENGSRGAEAGKEKSEHCDVQTVVQTERDATKNYVTHLVEKGTSRFASAHQ